MELNLFIKKVVDFNDLPASARIDFFIYHLINERQFPGVKARNIQDCFHELNLIPYSNISGYLNNGSKRGKNQKYLKRGEFFFLENSTKLSIEKAINTQIISEPSNDLLSISIFDGTRKYLVAFSKEAMLAYDFGLYNSCFFMIRKIMETLIIELFERHGIDSKIKNANGGYFFFKRLDIKSCI